MWAKMYSTASFERNWAREISSSTTSLKTNIHIGNIASALQCKLQILSWKGERNDFIAQIDFCLFYVHYKNLKYLGASLFATVLEDIIFQLRILEECNNAMRVDKTKLEMMMLEAQKFAVPEHKGGDELENIDVKRLDCLEYKLQKLEDDRKYLHDVVIGTFSDLALNRTFLSMTEDVKNVVGRIEYREFLIAEEAKNRVLRRELNRQLRQKRNHMKSVYYDTDLIIDSLKTNVEDAGLNTQIRSRYVENWQLSRTEQHLQTLHDKETKPLETIMHLKRRTDQEHRIHSEVELLTNISINETLQKIEDWMNKFDRDIESLDLQIQKSKNQLEDTIKRNKELEELMEEHARLMKDWVTFKEEREKARLYREKMNDAAVTVQAWWRGLLVRNQLGPYKVVKRPPPPAKGGKKKK